jgi:Zn-dependent peptidase ImmA (M78 family)
VNKLILEKKATEFRRVIGLGSEDCVRLKSALSKLNVITVFKPLSKNLSGMAMKIVTEEGEEHRLMMVNSTNSLGRQHFTICHELYHLYIQQDFTFQYCQTGQFNKSKDSNEYYADVFAALFLMPELGIKELIPDNELGKNKITIQTILKIEQYFSCSRSALLYRLKELSIIDNVGYEKYNQNKIKSAVQNGFSVNLYRPGNDNLVLGGYGSLARKLFDDEKISETHYLNLLIELGMHPEEIEKQLIIGEGGEDNFS